MADFRTIPSIEQLRQRQAIRALDTPRAPAHSRQTGVAEQQRSRARFWPAAAPRLRDLFHIVGPADATEVLIDDRPVPYSRELWLPLVWFLIPR